MPTSALTILTAAFQDIGAIQQGETLDAATGADGLRRLNNMVSGWRTQYGTVTAIERQIFPLTENQQTYTIGVGGDFNVPRPATIPGAGLLMQGLASAAAVTGITRSGYTATVDQTAHGLSVGDEALIQGANELLYNGLQTVATVPDADTWTYTVEGTPTTPATGTITASALDGQPVEIPRAVITDEAYRSINIKNLPNAEFTNVYYRPTYPFGQIVLWPKPNTTINQLVLYLQNVFTGFADLTTEYAYPELPGYAEALQYNIAVRLSTPYARPLPPTIADLAKETLGLIKRANNKLVDVPTDATLLTRWPSGLFDINSGTTQGTGN